MNKKTQKKENQKVSSQKPAAGSNASTRPPVVVVLGHVDHGKTKLIDYIRSTNVIGKEAGGITQHIGAYQVKHSSSDSGQSPPSHKASDGQGRVITFLDTPGHEAFSAIRARGAKIADIAILVIAVDEGVKPQTKEAIEFIKREKMPYIVAINKIDKEGANPNKVKQELSENEVFVETWGGQVPVVEISAKNGQGIDNLLEMIKLVADIEDLKADKEISAKGVVIESHLDNRRGAIATLLVQDGVLKLNDWVVSGNSFARIKLMEDFTGKEIDTALPSEPTLTLGWETAPELGQDFKVVNSKDEAEKLIKENVVLEEPVFIRESGAEISNKKILNIVLKADVRSSLEAISQAIKNIKHEEVGYNVVSYGVGNISNTDVKMVAPTNGIIYGFYTGIEESAKLLAEKEKVKIQVFNVIYDLIKALRDELSDLLEPGIKRISLGKVKILALFGSDAKSQVVGGEVTKGKVVRGALIDVLRNNGVVVSGKLVQLQHEKADVGEVKEGLQCGIKFEGPAQIQEGDMLDIYQEEKIKRTI